MKIPMATAIFAISFACGSTPASSWDPIGDITSGKVFENVVRETDNAIKDIPNVPGNIAREIGNVGAEFDRMRREFEAVTTAPLLAAWIRASRNSARGTSSPIPQDVRNALGNFFDEDVYNRVHYKIGDGGALNLANLSIQYGEAGAVTLDDTVVFATQQGANDPILWAHELWHVKQFRDWGVDDFAIRYIRSYNSVENEATGAENRFAQIYMGSQSSVNGVGIPNIVQPPTMQMPMQSPPSNMPPPVFMPQPVALAGACLTPMGGCYLGQPLPMNSPCYCPTPMGPVWGNAR